MDQPKIPSPDMERILRDAPTLTCSACGHGVFHEAVIFKHLSELLSPNGKAGAVPIPTMACDSCGAVHEAFLPTFLKTSVKEPENTVLSTPKIEIIK